MLLATGQPNRGSWCRRERRVQCLHHRVRCTLSGRTATPRERIRTWPRSRRPRRWRAVGRHPRVAASKWTPRPSEPGYLSERPDDRQWRALTVNAARKWRSSATGSRTLPVAPRQHSPAAAATAASSRSGRRCSRRQGGGPAGAYARVRIPRSQRGQNARGVITRSASRPFSGGPSCNPARIRQACIPADHLLGRMLCTVRQFAKLV